MVVPAGDSLLYGEGFASDASDAIPDIEDAAIPTDGDIAALPEDGYDDGAASPDPEPFSVESLSLSPEQLAAIETHYRGLIAPEVEATFAEERSQWERARRSLEGAAEANKIEYVKAAAYHAAAQEVIADLLANADPTEVDAIKYRLQSRAQGKLGSYAKKIADQQTQTQQVQQAQTAAQEYFDSELSRVRTLAQEHAKQYGIPATHQLVDQSFDELVLPAARAVSRNPGDPDLLAALEAAKKAHKTRVDEYGKALQRRKDAQPAAEATARQRARGPQNLSRGAGGAAPMSLTQTIESLRQSHPNLPYEELHPMAYAQWQATRR